MRCSYFGYMPLAAQCGTVFLFDPQPLCAHSIAAAITKNGFDNAYVVANPVTDTPGTTMDVDSQFNCNGRWPIEQDDVGTDPKTTVVVQAVTLQQVLPAGFSSIYFAKVDTEGGELAVLHSLMPYILKKKVLILPLSPLRHPAPSSLSPPSSSSLSPPSSSSISPPSSCIILTSPSSRFSMSSLN